MQFLKIVHNYLLLLPRGLVPPPPQFKILDLLLVLKIKSMPRLVRGQNGHFASKGLVIRHLPAVERGTAVHTGQLGGGGGAPLKP